MEKRINSRIRQHQLEFKNNLKEKIINDISKLTFNEIKNDENKNTFVSSFAQNLITYIYEYENLTFSQQDFQKRKRIKNIVPLCDRCAALRANKDRCTRRKKSNSIF